MSSVEKLLDMLVSRSPLERETAKNQLLGKPKDTLVVLVPELEVVRDDCA